MRSQNYSPAVLMGRYSLSGCREGITVVNKQSRRRLLQFTLNGRHFDTSGSLRMHVNECVRASGFVYVCVAVHVVYVWLSMYAWLCVGLYACVWLSMHA